MPTLLSLAPVSTYADCREDILQLVHKRNQARVVDVDPMFPSASTTSFIFLISMVHAHALGLVCAMFLVVSLGDSLAVFAYLECAGLGRRCRCVPKLACVQEDESGRGSGEQMKVE